jgi:DNA polymerase V
MSVTILGRTERLRHLLPEAKELRITGFQSPAEDEKEGGLSLDKLVGLGAPQIWVVLMEDASALGFGIFPGDRLVVDRAAPLAVDHYVIVDLDGDSQYRVRLVIEDAAGRKVLQAPNGTTPPLLLDDDACVEVWGVVLWVISYVGRPPCPFSR